jgi:Tol biopolymer transport system component
MDGVIGNMLGLRGSNSVGIRRRTRRAYRPAPGLEAVEGRTLLSASLVSVHAGGVAGGDGGSQLPFPASFGAMNANSGEGSIGGDGKSLVFQSDATDLVPGVVDSNTQSDIFVRDLQTGQTQLVSATAGGQAGNGRSYQPMISPDGRYVVFMSTATNLTGVRANRLSASAYGSFGNLYLRDLETQTTTLLDVATDGKASDGSATGGYAFSPDGTELAFTDTSTNLTSTAPSESSLASDPNSGGVYSNIFLRNLATGATEAVTVTPDGALSQGNLDYGGPSSQLAFSPDGMWLAFSSSATDLTGQPPAVATAPGPMGPDANLYVRDLSAGKTDLVSATPDGTPAHGISSQPVFSPDGHLLAFLSTATTLTPGSPQAAPADSPDVPSFSTNLFVRDLTAGTTEAASVTTDGALSSGFISQMAFSPDGKSLAFISNDNDLTDTPVGPSTATMPPMGANLTTLATGVDPSTTAMPPMAANISTLLTGVDPSTATMPPTDPSLSMLQTSADPSAATMPPIDARLMALGMSNVYSRDLSTGVTTAVSVSPDGTLSNGNASNLAFTPDGHSLAYLSSASDLTVDPSTKPAVPTPSDGSMPMPMPMPVLTATNLFLTDLATGATTPVSVTPDGTLSQGYVSSYGFSPDGKFIAFTDSGTDLTENPPAQQPGQDPSGLTAMSFNNWINSLYVRDMGAGTTTLIGAASDGSIANDPINYGVSRFFFGPASTTIYFNTGANLAAGDTNNAVDIYSATAPFASPGAIHFASWLYHPDASATSVTIKVVRNAPLDGDETVNYQVGDGTARAGVDFEATSGSLHFAPGQAAATFTIPLIARPSTTDPRTATIRLSANGAPLGVPPATLMLGEATMPSMDTPGIADGSSPIWASTFFNKPSTPGSAASKGSDTGSTTSATPKGSDTGSTTSATPKDPGTTPAPTITWSLPVKTPATTPIVLSDRPVDYSSSAATVQASIDAANATAKNAVGPRVASVTVRASRHAIKGVVIQFNEPLALASAGNPANYKVHLLHQGRTRGGIHRTSVGQAVGVASARYDGSARTVTLAFRSSLKAGQHFQIKVRGGSGGVADPAGNLLNSMSKGAPGSDYVLDLF